MTIEADAFCEFCGSLLVGGHGGSCPTCAWYEGDDYDDGTGTDLDKCPYCRGTGYVNPLTAPDYQFCVGTEECAACDGEGRIQ